jgi:hypothetical protein
MAQNGRDRVERDSLAQHRCGSRMPQDVRATRTGTHARTIHRAGHEPRHRSARPQRRERCSSPHEQVGGYYRWAGVL